MLNYLGLESVEDLFADVPEHLRLEQFDLPLGMSEQEVCRHVDAILSLNRSAVDMPCFLGGDCRQHYVPAAVEEIVSRTEFRTAYTPYQPEMSQGMLQALFEYQSLMAELVGLDVVNSSMYDWTTALGEAARMCMRINRRKRFLVPRAMSPQKRSVLNNYVLGTGMTVGEYGYDQITGEVDMDDLVGRMGDDVAGVYVEVPNAFGIIDSRAPELKAMAGEALLVVGVDPLSMAVLRPPGDYGADMVIGEAQWLGSPMNCGGPMLGLFACRERDARRSPGRIIGMTKDSNGRDAYTMALQTREQHIRRDKATSNICSNEALVAVGAAAYLSIMGAEGLTSLARSNMRRTRRLMEMVDAVPGFEAPEFTGQHFDSFVVRCPMRVEKVNRLLLRNGIIGGMHLGPTCPEFDSCMILSVNEVQTDADHENLIELLEGMA